MTVGELYKRLVVLPPKTYHSYYQKVKDTIEEAMAEFPTLEKWGTPPYKGDEDDWIVAMQDWFRKWFGDV